MGDATQLQICLQVSGGSIERTVVVSVADQDGTAIGMLSSEYSLYVLVGCTDVIEDNGPCSDVLHSCIRNWKLLLLHGQTLFTYAGGVDYDEFEIIVMTIDLTFDGGNIARRKRNVISGPSCFYISSIPDEIVEFDESFELELSSDDPDITLFPSSATITIIDNDCKSY